MASLYQTAHSHLTLFGFHVVLSLRQHQIVAQAINDTEGREAAISFACDVTDRERVYAVIKDAQDKV